MSGQTNLKLPSGGTLTLAAADSVSNNTATFPANSGTVITTGSTGGVSQNMLGTNVAGNGPAFSAYLSTNQTISANTWTKIAFDTKIFDTNTNFSTANSRFTPTVAGYYQINCNVQLQGSGINVYIQVYKNGSGYAYGNTNPTGSGGSSPICTANTLVYCNGSTDYIEIYGFSGGTTIGQGAAATQFSGFLARSA